MNPSLTQLEAPSLQTAIAPDNSLQGLLSGRRITWRLTGRHLIAAAMFAGLLTGAAYGCYGIYKNQVSLITAGLTIDAISAIGLFSLKLQ